ncbi:hypothetical protein [Xanthomonas phage RTH11]|nr:hypothetical protein [Xanthomonas phage RTH11]
MNTQTKPIQQLAGRIHTKNGDSARVPLVELLFLGDLTVDERMKAFQDRMRAHAAEKAKVRMAKAKRIKQKLMRGRFTHRHKGKPMRQHALVS